MPLAKKVEAIITEEDYLEGEQLSEVKHEYIDGNIYAMAGASAKHNLISGNINRELSSQLKNKKSPCDVFSSDMKVKISHLTTRFFYPDIMVVCEKNNDDYYQHSPIIIIEVLSKSTRKHDFTTKMMSYFNIPSLEEYVLIEQDICQVTVYRKDKNWQSSSYFLGDDIHFESININISVEDIYYHIDNEEIATFLIDQKNRENNK